MEKGKKWLLLKAVVNEIEAEVLRGFLQGSGIPCFIHIVDRGVCMSSGVAPVGRFEIYVDEGLSRKA